MACECVGVRQPVVAGVSTVPFSQKSESELMMELVVANDDDDG